jgi:hypothetical protein
MAEKKKRGRPSGSKVETYTYRAKWKAEADGLAALRVAQEKLRAKGYKVTHQKIVEVCVQVFLDKLSPQAMVKSVEGSMKATKAAQDAAEREAKLAALKKQQQQLDLQIAGLEAVQALPD